MWGSFAAGRAGRSGGFLVALDPFEDVCREAAEWGAELLVTHHPLIFQPVRALTDDTSVGRCLLFLAARDMAAINAHTNLDCAPRRGQRLPGRGLGTGGDGGATSLRRRRGGAALGGYSGPGGGSRFPWRRFWSR